MNDYSIILSNMILINSLWVNCDNNFFSFISLLISDFIAWYLLLFIFTMYAFLSDLFIGFYIISPFSSDTVNEIFLLQYSKLKGMFPANS